MHIMRRSRTAAALAAIVASGAVGAQTWNNPGADSWFVAGNWLPPAVPVAGGVVIVSNGGTAILSGVPSTPVLGSLSIGLAGSGSGEGTVISNGVAIGTSNGIFAGLANGAGAAFTVDGTLVVNGASVQATTSAIFGGIFSTTAAGSATGTGVVTGGLGLNGGFLAVGETLSAARGSVANGTLVVGGDAGSTVFTTVGSTFPADATQVGTSAAGTLAIGGNLAVGSGALNVGAAFSARDGAFFDTASGTATIGGTLTFQGATGLNVGLSGGGVGNGQLQVGTLDFSAGQANFVGIGTAVNGGTASGLMTATLGDMRVGGPMSVGTASGVAILPTSGNGSLAIGGALTCIGACGALSVGTSTGSGAATSIGSVTSAGLAGFTSYSVGLVSSTPAASSATGSLVSTGTGTAGSTNSVLVGSVFGADAASDAQGTMTVGGSLLVTGDAIAVGETLAAARGSTASGSLSIAGDAGSTVFTTVGSTFASDASQIGTQATGTLAIGGNLEMLGGALSVGTFAGREGTNVDVAQGSATIGGTLSFNGVTSLSVGLSSGGIAAGSLDVGAIDTSLGRADVFAIGVASNGGTASGRIAATSGELRTGFGLTVGGANGNASLPTSADGTLSLGGALTCVSFCGGLSVGTATGPGLVLATGSVEAAGVSGYAGYSVGSLSSAAAGSRAEGSLIVGSGGMAPPAPTGALSVGFGQNGNAPGTSVEGLVRVNGDAGAYTFVSVGLGVSSAASHTGAIEITGGTLGTQFTSIGTLLDNGSAAASADGTVRLDSAHVLATGLALTTIGFVNGNGSATGRLLATDSTLSLGTVTVGGTLVPGGTATGIVELVRSDLAASSLFAGFGPGASALLSLAGSTLSVSGNATLFDAVLRLDDSLVDVAAALTLSDATTLEIDVDGLLRGIDYGAIDAATAALDGALRLSFDDLVPVGDLMAFDLVVSGSASGIDGDFDFLTFSGLPAGFSLLAGVVLDGVEIYRVTLVRNAVDEPGTALLVLAAIAVLGAARRRARG
jgi:hypothetical protein